jgi:acetyl-CoA C-acetyltransferase/acetyl-CoA acyltransferase
LTAQTPFIIDAIRSPSGRIKAGGAFTQMHPADLLAQVLQHLVRRNGLDPAEVDDVITGCVSQVGEQSASPGRIAWLGAGFPDHVPSTTIDRKCGSSQQAIAFGAQAIMAGEYDIVIACGVESMSRVPMGSARIDKDPFGSAYAKRYGRQISQGMAAERVAGRWQLSREQLDSYAATSHERAAAAVASGQFAREIVPIVTAEGTCDKDETIRMQSTAAQLGKLMPAFADESMRERFPEIGEWRVTAGNSSQMSDGAAAVLLVSERAAKRLGLKPRARFVAFDVRGDDPMWMLTAPIASSQAALKKAGLGVHEIDAFEVNEAFAPVPLAWLAELNADPALLNPSGGAIALGHPLGASGARLTTTLLNWLELSGGRYGLQTMCEAGGMANTMIIERI